MMLSHLPVERVKFYKIYNAKFQFYQKTENSTTSQHGSELKFFSSYKRNFSFRCNVVFFCLCLFVCLTNTSILPGVYLLT